MTATAYREYELLVSITDVRVWPGEDGVFPEGEALTSALEDAVCGFLSEGGSLGIQPEEIGAFVAYDEDGEEVPE